MSESLQDRYSPNSWCFGCGPKNDKGLRIKSRIEGALVVAEFTPEPHHETYTNILNGGIIGTLLDCHSSWTAALHLMAERGESAPPCVVTADFHVKLRKPTPMTTLQLRARVVQGSGDRAVVEAELLAGDLVTASCRGTFVAVKEGHPAFHRW
jgi:acyl-coenzyme A thioesterase PaaI-like protein